MRTSNPIGAARDSLVPTTWRLMRAAVLACLLLATPAVAQIATLSLRAAPDPIAPDGRLGYAVTVINEGTADKDFKLSLTFDPRLALLAIAREVGDCTPCEENSACGDPGSCNPSGVCANLAPDGDACVLPPSDSRPHWIVGNVSSGGSVTLYLEFTVDAADAEDPAPIETTGEVAEFLSGETFGTPAAAAVSTAVLAGAAATPLLVNLVGTPKDVAPGDELTYNATLTNLGAFAREIAVVTEFDPDVTFVRSVPDGDHCFVSPPCADVQPGESLAVRLGVTVGSQTTRVALKSRLRATDGLTGATIAAEETTVVRVCNDAVDGTACDNGDACAGDACHGGTCVPTACPEACEGAENGAPCSDGDVCTMEECKDGACVATLRPDGSPLTLQCDACETCDRVLACVTTGTADRICREALRVCDAEEKCNGVDPECPADVFLPDTTPCDDGNPATAGDQCTTVDETARCVGALDPCGDGVLDPDEECDDGNTAVGDCCSSGCRFETAGSSCSDANVCNGLETCDDAGSCQPGTPLVCVSDTICAASELCDPVVGCLLGPRPATGCFTGFAKASLLIDEVRVGRERLSLKLAKGPALSPADFGNPTVTGGTGYTVCFYRGGDHGFAGALEVSRAGQQCGKKACWKAVRGKRFQYRDPGFSADGIGVIGLFAGARGHSSISLEGKNDAKRDKHSLPAGTAPGDGGIAKGLDRSFAGVLVQIRRNDGGACFEARLGKTLRSGPTYFKAKQ